MTKNFSDCWGLLVDPERIKQDLLAIGKTEQECHDFFGEFWEMNGFANGILQLIAASQNWAVEVEERKYAPRTYCK